MVNELDYAKLANLNATVIDVLADDIESSIKLSDMKSLTKALRATGLALGNISKLKAMQKRDKPEEEDDNLSELLTQAKEKAAKLYGKAEEAKASA